MTKKEQAIAAVDRYSDELCALSDAIWDHPEVGYTEKFAKETYCAFLKKEGFSVTENLGDIPTAFCGSYGSGSPVVGILAEFDALPGLSQKAESMVKEPVKVGGAGHGCGHNLLGGGALAAAVAAKAYLQDGHVGTVVFYGCPAEENGSGKAFLAKAGAFDRLDAAFSWHPGDCNSVGMGSTLANYKVIYHFHGKTSHAAIGPELGRSALDAMELMNVGAQFLREHISTECRVHYAITDGGGEAPNVVQDHADVTYLMRAPQLPVLTDLYERVTANATGAAIMTGTTVDCEFVKACSNMLPNVVLAKVMQKNLEELGAAQYSQEDRDLAAAIGATIAQKGSFFRVVASQVENSDRRTELLKYADDALCEVVLPLGKESTGPASSDVGDVSWVCPVAQISMATMPAGTPMHSWQEVAVGKSGMAHKGMLQAGRVIAASVIDTLSNPDIVAAAKQEKNARTNGVPFASLIPDGVKPSIPVMA